MAVWSTVTASNIQESFGRFDAEFYRPENLEAFNQVTTKNFELIARLATDGYRVVYENTKILPSKRVTGDCPIFLQATNISANGLAIDFLGAGYVSESDWNRYPKGRIQPGELLIEVKGQAEKVAIVPQDINERVLVSGSLFKLSVDKSKINPWYVFAYFSTKHGKLLRDRLKTNTLIGFVSKPQLYSIPVFIPDDEVDINQVATLSEKAFSLLKESEASYTQAQQLLESELGLDKLRFDKPMGYTARFSELALSRRADAEFFNPELCYFQKEIAKNHQLSPITDFVSILKFSNPTYSGVGLPIITQKHLGKISPSNYGDDLVAHDAWVLANPLATIGTFDLLYYSVGAYLGKTNIWLSDEKAVHASFITMLRPFDPAESGFLHVLLNSKYGILQSKCFQSGTSQPYIYPKDIKRFLIPFVSKSLRRQIHELVIESFRKGEESKHLLDQAKSRVEQLIEEAVRA